MWNSVTFHQSHHTHTCTDTATTPKGDNATKGACCHLAGWPDGYSGCHNIEVTGRSQQVNTLNWTQVRQCGRERHLRPETNTTSLKKIEKGRNFQLINKLDCPKTRPRLDHSKCYLWSQIMHVKREGTKEKQKRMKYSYLTQHYVSQGPVSFVIHAVHWPQPHSLLTSNMSHHFQELSRIIAITRHSVTAIHWRLFLE